jgi:hypothetical protein
MNTDRLIAFTQALVRERSLSGEERPVVDVVAGEMRARGFDQMWVDANGSTIGVIDGAGLGPQCCWTRIATR